MKLFPTLPLAPIACVGLNNELKAWIARNGTSGMDPKRFLEPSLISDLVQDICVSRSLKWHFGGYMEDRSFWLQASYLQKTGNFMHLGIDFNIPAGTPVAATMNSKVIVVDDDHELSCGWGPRVIVQSLERAQEGWGLIYGHLTSIQVHVGQMLKPGDIIANVGHPPHNGNWYPHLHLQACAMDHLNELIRTDILKLDGYGNPADRAKLMRLFPDPLPIGNIELATCE